MSSSSSSSKCSHRSRCSRSSLISEREDRRGKRETTALRLGQLVQLFERHQNDGVIRRSEHEKVLRDLLPEPLYYDEDEEPEVRQQLWKKRIWSLRAFLTAFIDIFTIWKQRRTDASETYRKRAKKVEDYEIYARQKARRIDAWRGTHETSPDTSD